MNPDNCMTHAVVNEQAMHALRLMVLHRLRCLLKADPQLRKPELARAAVNWRGGLPRLAPSSPFYLSYHALRRAATTLTDVDVEAAYGICVACLEAWSLGANNPVEIPRDLNPGDLLYLIDGDVAVVGGVSVREHYLDDGCVVARPRRNTHHYKVWRPDGRNWDKPDRLWVVCVERVPQKGQTQ